VFYLASSANGTNHTGKQPNTYSESEVHPTSVLPLRQNLVTELPWVMQMQTGGVTWTLDALLPAMSSRSMAALLRGKAGVSQLLLCLLPKQSTWHQQMQHDRLSGLDFCLMTFSLVLATNLSPS